MDSLPSADQVVERLREAAERLEIDQFLTLYAQSWALFPMVRTARLTGVVYRHFEPMVLTELRAGRVKLSTLARLVRAAREGSPALANPELLRELNERAQALDIAGVPV